MKFIFLFFIIVLTPLHANPIEIVLWHSMSGQLGSEVKKLTNGFNKSQSNYVVKPVYKGVYLESLTSFSAAFRAKQPPSIIQVFEVGIPTMLAPKGIIKPAEELMQEQGFSLPVASFFPAVRAHYTEKGRLMAMPFNISLPVIFYNADVLSELGYNAGSFPDTWDEMEILAEKLRNKGFSCAYTSAYTGWVLIESYSAIHGLPMIRSGGAAYNNKHVIHHLERLLRWQKLHYFEYGGRADDSTTLFTSGRCPLFSQSSGSFKGLSSLVSFQVGMAALPLDKKASVKRFNDVVGGAALWTVAGQSQETYQGIARFFSYLAQPKIQQDWHHHTGYLPLGGTGIYAKLVAESAHPSITLAKNGLSKDKGALLTTGMRVQNQTRLINDEALEVIFAGIKMPQEAMDDAVKRANHAMSRFRKNTNYKEKGTL